MLKLINEDKTQVIPIPNNIEEPEENTLETPSEEQTIKNAWSFSINKLVESSWSLIDEINSVIASLDVNESGNLNKNDVKEILNGVVDEMTISIGMLNKAATIVDGTKKDLMDAGEEKANAIIGGSEENENSEETDNPEE